MGLDTVKVTVHNVPPDAQGGDDITCYEDEAVTFDASHTVDTPNDLPSLQYEWDFGDGVVANGTVVTHTYPNSGVYYVLLKPNFDIYPLLWGGNPPQ